MLLTMQFTFNWFQFTFNWFSIDFNLLSIDFPLKSKKSTQQFLCTIEYHPNNYMIEYLCHSWGTPLKNCLDAVFNKGLIRHLIVWKTLHSKPLTWLWLFKVNGPALPKERWIKGFVFFSPQKFLRTIEYHPNNYIIEYLGHSWGTPLKNCLDAVFNKGLIRHLIIWKTLHSKPLTWLWLFKVNGPALPKERWIKGFVFFHPKSFCAQ